MIADKLNSGLVAGQYLGKLKAYFEMLKFRLSFLVVFSAAIGYMLALPGNEMNWNHFMLFLLGGFLMTGSSNIINQIIEKDSDKLMKRTAKRPLPTGRVSVPEAITLSVIMGVVGFSILILYTNAQTALLTLLSMVLYGFAYTPMKRVSSVAVLIGAIPGALPTLIGWVAVTDHINVEGLLLFSIQFIWQFPHFWAIAWVLDEDYKNAGIRLLPAGGEKNINTAFQIMIYTLMLIPLGLIPAKLGITGINSAIVATVCGVLFLMQTFYLMKECSSRAARQIMFGSFLYLPIVQIAFVLDKI
ncbi:MAG: heme o synthase [Cytophagaceae bacterium]